MASRKNSPKQLVSILHQKLVTAQRNVGQKGALALRWLLIFLPMSVSFQLELLKNGAVSEIWTAMCFFSKKSWRALYVQGKITHQKQLVKLLRKKQFKFSLNA